MNKNTLSAVGIAVALIISVFSLYKPTQVIVEKPTQIAGAVSSPDIPSPYFSYGDVRFWAAKTNNYNAATTTVCALQSPAATSTLDLFSVRFDVGTTTNSIVTIARDTTAFGTSTAIETVSVTANTQALIIASTTVEKSLRVFAPNTFLVVGMAGGRGTFSPSGVCQATWLQN